MPDQARCYAEIRLDDIGHNLRAVRGRLKEQTRLLAVVKANAYGHGAIPVASYIQEASLADAFATATVDEACELRAAGITLPILVLGYCDPAQFEEALRADIALTIYHTEDAERLGKIASGCARKARVHAAVDTGMTRIGFRAEEGAAEPIARMAAVPGISLEGMFTHFACADQADQTHADAQSDRFTAVRDALIKKGIQIPVSHICNSAGIMERDADCFDLVRAGIVIYGIYPSEEVRRDRLALRPALSWRARVIHVQEVPRGTSVSYGATWTSERDMTRIATLSVGYADGYPRALSSRGSVLLCGRRAPIVGRVCMDQMMVDVTEIPDVRVGMAATLIGRDGDLCIPVEEVADPAGRFNYEMLCNISARVSRIYV